MIFLFNNGPINIPNPGEKIAPLTNRNALKKFLIDNLRERVIMITNKNKRPKL